MEKFSIDLNSLGSFENSGSIFEFTNSVYLTIHEKDCLIFLHLIVKLFSFKFGCHGNSLASLEISDSIFGVRIND